MGNFADLSGKKFNKLTVIRRDKTIISGKSRGRISWLCLCECGKETVVSGSHLKTEHTKSCGCIQSPNDEKYIEIKKIKIKNNCKINNETGCWEWKGYITPNGYGLTNLRILKCHHVLAHRAAWMLFRGKIPETLFVCHKCDNSKCINPDHLFLGTQSDNMQDMLQKKRNGYTGHKGSKHHRAKLSDEQVKEIMHKVQNFYIIKILAKEYNVSETAIFNIVEGKTWKHLPEKD